MPVAEARTQAANPHASAALIASLWLFATACNVGKAFHIDDTAHLEIARWIADNPWRPMSGWLHWGDDIEPIHHTNQPHLYFYLMALWAQVFGWRETAMHALMAVFALWAIRSFHRLATRIAPEHALAATAALALCPAFVVGQNSMVDIPLLALWLACYLGMIDGADRHRHGYARAALICAAALLTKYTSVVLMPALALSTLLARRPRAAAWLLVPVLALAAWSMFNLLDYGGIHLLGRRAEPQGLARTGEAAIAWVLTLGAITPFAPLVLATVGTRTTRPVLRPGWYALAVLSALAPAVLLTGWLLGSSLPTQDRLYPVLKLSFGAGGLGLLAAAARALWRQSLAPEQRASACLLGLWLASSLIFVVALAPFIATRHVILALPPLLLLYARDLPAHQPIGRRAPSRAWPHWPMAFTCATSLAVCGVLATGDRWYAQVYREAPERIRASLPPGATLWFTGHWGWQWYAGEAGFRQLSAQCDRPAIGDFIISPTTVSGSPIPEGLRLQAAGNLTLSREHWAHRWVATPAGFYASTRWRLPWSYADEPIDVIQVWRVAGHRPTASTDPRHGAACAHARDRSWPRIRP